MPALDRPLTSSYRRAACPTTWRRRCGAHTGPTSSRAGVGCVASAGRVPAGTARDWNCCAWSWSSRSSSCRSRRVPEPIRLDPARLDGFVENRRVGNLTLPVLVFFDGQVVIELRGDVEVVLRAARRHVIANLR